MTLDVQQRLSAVNDRRRRHRPLKEEPIDTQRITKRTRRSQRLKRYTHANIFTRLTEHLIGPACGNTPDDTS